MSSGFIHVVVYCRFTFFLKLGCYHTLAIVNNAAVNGAVNGVSFGICVFCVLWVYTHKWNSWDYMVVLVLILGRISMLFSIEVASIYGPTNSVEGFPFLYILS